ncbi:type VI immunity family protein [Melittangium boletus]|uniref:type VI immunity family protein n=1 Tax=Melittangium boletus TaxID=83453 RepID=UPI000BB2D1F0|nr:type VI immunity family protein [Melittangium boletus]
MRLAFYLPYDHPEIAAGVSHAVESYMRAVGQSRRTINHVFINDDEGDTLSDERWSYSQELLRPERPFRFIEELDAASAHRLEKRGYATQLLFSGGLRSRNGYELHYRARIPWRNPSMDAVSILTATFPMTYLEQHGAERVRELALDMASQLRFVTGHGGLALHFYWGLSIADEAFRTELARYPGIDLRTAWPLPTRLGAQVDGVHWLNFLAQPALGQLGGATALRSRIHAPGTTVHAIDEDRVVVSLGEMPESGDLSVGQTLPSYREFAKVLEPWLEPLTLSETTLSDEPPRYSDMHFTADEARSWWRRLLD